MIPPAPGQYRDPSRGVYGITVASELAEISPQTLRLYERKGLLEPGRSPGGTRRYSDDDLARLRRVEQLVAAGINLAGIEMILNLQDDNDRLTAALRQLQPDQPHPAGAPHLPRPDDQNPHQTAHGPP